MFVSLSLLVCLLPQDSSELPWPDYRGAARDGHGPGAHPPLVFGEQENVAWRTALPGQGLSSPVVGEGLVWLTSSDPEGKRLSVLAIGAEDGELRHQRVVFENEAPQPIRNKLNGYASPSVVLDAGRVFVHFGTAGSACIDSRTGRTIWSRNDLPLEHLEGPGSSPLLHAGLLILHLDGADTQSVIALDADTGETRWRSYRSVDLGGLAPALRKAYSTPIVIEAAGQTRIVSTGAGASMAYDPCSGRELWRVLHGGYSMSSRPVALLDARGEAQLVFVNTGYDRPELWAIRPGGAEDVSETHVAWRGTRRVANLAAPLLVDGRLLMLADNGVATLLDAESGELLWQERVTGPACASPVFCDGGGLPRYYICDRAGVTVVLTAGAQPEVIARNRLEQGCMASPALLPDALLLRTDSYLYRIQRTP